MRSPTLLLSAVVLAVGCKAPAPPPAALPAEPKRVRLPAEAGRFYPADAAELDAQVQGFLAKAKKVATAPVRMVLVPHAGLEYSGQIAAESFRQLEPGFERVVLIAGNHEGKARFTGLSVDRATHYRVPGLEVKVAQAAAELSGPLFVDAPAAHAMHMIEIELPFVKAVNGRPFEIVPIIVGALDGEQLHAAATALGKLALPKTLFVFSVDLSHYYTWEQAEALDKPCLDALARADAQQVAACDTDATQVLMLMNELGGRLGLKPRLLAYANSGDVSGDRSRVVGYGALVYEEGFQLSAEEGGALVTLARRALETYVREGKRVPVPPELTLRFPRLGSNRAAFVTLKKGGQLRGCIGSLQAERPLADDVVAHAIDAAVNDSRFSPVRAGELSAIAVSISALTPPRPLELDAESLVKRLADTHPGLIIDSQGRRSTFLPEVWEELPDATDFLDRLCRKQGSPKDCWRDRGTRFQTYQAQHFVEN